MKPRELRLDHTALGMSIEQMDMVLTQVFGLNGEAVGYSYSLQWEMTRTGRRSVILTMGQREITYPVNNTTLLENIDEIKNQYGWKLNKQGEAIECSPKEMFKSLAHRDVKRVFRFILIEHYNHKILELSSW